MAGIIVIGAVLAMVICILLSLPIIYDVAYVTTRPFFFCGEIQWFGKAFFWQMKYREGEERERTLYIGFVEKKASMEMNTISEEEENRAGMEEDEDIRPFLEGIEEEGSQDTNKDFLKKIKNNFRQHREDFKEWQVRLKEEMWWYPYLTNMGFLKELFFYIRKLLVNYRMRFFNIGGKS